MKRTKTKTTEMLNQSKKEHILILTRVKILRSTSHLQKVALPSKPLVKITTMMQRRTGLHWSHVKESEWQTDAGPKKIVVSSSNVDTKQAAGEQVKIKDLFPFPKGCPFLKCIGSKWHCPNSFRPPTPLSNGQTWKKVLSTILASPYPLHPRTKANVGKSAPTAKHSWQAFTPPPFSGNAPMEQHISKRGIPKKTTIQQKFKSRCRRCCWKCENCKKCRPKAEGPQIARRSLFRKKSTLREKNVQEKNDENGLWFK